MNVKLTHFVSFWFKLWDGKIKKIRHKSPVIIYSEFRQCRKVHQCKSACGRHFCGKRKKLKFNSTQY